MDSLGVSWERIVLGSLVVANVLATANHSFLDGHPSSANIARQLGPQLSSRASVFGKDDPKFANATARWQSYQPPDIGVVVQVGTEEDVATTVKFANQVGVPFLAVNRGHGIAASQSKLRRGIEIWLEQLDDFEIFPNTSSAFLQGGVWAEQIQQPLWDAGYVISTGSCACVSLLGPALGGGLGLYQGHYGLIADGIISMNVVLANGSAVTVSENSHPDLWWGMRGAGHNFGIVTSFHAQIHRRTVDEWYFAQYIFTEEKVEVVSEALNSLMENNQPKELSYFATFLWNTSISTTAPVVQLTFYYAGAPESAAPYLEPFQDLGPAFVADNSVPYPQIPNETGNGATSPDCQKGLTRMHFATGLEAYNGTATRQVFALFKAESKRSPAIQENSVVVFEGYSVQGVKAVDPDSTAYAHRGDNILAAVIIGYPPNSALDSDIIAWGNRAVHVLVQGRQSRRRTTYVNYALGTGDESLESIYGYEPWRLQKLVHLKRRYDPDQRFAFYIPIPV
ncbi:uncharacterized protein K452DRAFT_298427 [Aplosporella prunicola CBS 121167]|uniref:FAD-binding PCMH-type domain-containing protein n=1 Tax=Aplosporella prunicola CBS 121167 TaxID=1176127 RepID=A0A6A6BGU6_9PEZI|nr:uncharacterized protein K452DRAFT_298427 [Aplosporella prunicola CBS 121167]KAF2141761.1 hypothetical protein K452DRAFT_298427 [Aplosporella prunicola CBS 121167]